MTFSPAAITDLKDRKPIRAIARQVERILHPSEPGGMIFYFLRLSSDLAEIANCGRVRNPFYNLRYTASGHCALSACSSIPA
jgi:hypothetical protein